ncbi:MAG TPA: ABC transporter substrate-binding protein [Rhodopila sp.]|uniref:ABC transporter substrate-binding protein n=1 Tax=Rhodopila sp. TaxID=2480087 RepID=UPI002BCFE4C7|nr:ABC transporter substrate-binding protein [Rhodopila sp.]HVY14031.1 ABC transporter substrate-binding protein [Rhodopila sp.]
MKSKLLALGMLAATAVAPAVVAPAWAQQAPKEIKVGQLYASSGPYASISMPVYDAFKLWVDEVNAKGGVQMQAFGGKRIPIKLIAYDDQSSTATAATLYNQLITQDHVDLLIADSGSVLTSVGVPIAKEHKQFLFDVSGTGAAFFSDDNPYIALMADPVSTIWPHYISDFLNDEGYKEGIRTVAILYSTNDFTGTQAAALKGFFERDKKVKVIYYQGVPTSTSNYTVLINNIAAQNPDAVLELGYVGNDIAFLRNLQDSGNQFRFVFSIYAGTELEEIEKNVGASAMKNVFSYVPASNYEYKPEAGMDQKAFHAAWDKKYPPGSGVAFGANAIYGYMTGVVVQKTLETTKSLDQMALHDAVFALSGKLKTLDGTFELRKDGAQIGEVTPLGQLQEAGKDKLNLVAVYPPNLANGKAILGK